MRHLGPGGRQTGVVEVALGGVEIVLGVDAQAQALAHRRRAASPEHEAVVAGLLDAPQIKRVAVTVTDRKAERVAIERMAAAEVLDGQDDVARPRGVERRRVCGAGNGHDGNRSPDGAKRNPGQPPRISPEFVQRVRPEVAGPMTSEDGRERPYGSMRAANPVFQQSLGTGHDRGRRIGDEIGDLLGRLARSTDRCPFRPSRLRPEITDPSWWHRRRGRSASTRSGGVSGVVTTARLISVSADTKARTLRSSSLRARSVISGTSARSGARLSAICTRM